MSVITLVEKPHGIWRTWIQGNPQISQLPRSIIPPFLPRAVCSSGTDSCVTSGGAQCCCGQLIPPRWWRWRRQRRLACPRRRQGANRVPAGSWDTRRAGTALRRSPAGEDAPPARTAGPLIPAPPSGRLGGSGCPRPGSPPALVAGPPAHQLSTHRALSTGSLRSLPAVPQPSWQPVLCSHSSPDFRAGY